MTCLFSLTCISAAQDTAGLDSAGNQTSEHKPGILRPKSVVAPSMPFLRVSSIFELMGIFDSPEALSTATCTTHLMRDYPILEFILMPRTIAGSSESHSPSCCRTSPPLHAEQCMLQLQQGLISKDNLRFSPAFSSQDLPDFSPVKQTHGNVL